MKSLVEHPAASLTWRRCGATPPDFELLGAGGVFATLAFLDDEHTLARVRTAEGLWTLKHLGVLAPAVTLREAGGTTNVATFHPHALRHGQLEFLDGATFDWKWLHRGSSAEPSWIPTAGPWSTFVLPPDGSPGPQPNWISARWIWRRPPPPTRGAPCSRPSAGI